MTENGKKQIPELKEGEQYLKAAYDPEYKSREKPHYVEYMDRAEAGLRTLKLVVFAGMAAFVILAIYGYYLIYQLTRDAAQMTVTMQEMSQTMGTMRPMSDNLAQMNQSVLQMAESVNRIQYSAGHMDRSFSTPMNVMNRVMSWGGERSYRPPTPMVPYPPPLGSGANRGDIPQ